MEYFLEIFYNDCEEGKAKHEPNRQGLRIRPFNIAFHDTITRAQDSKKQFDNLIRQKNLTLHHQRGRDIPSASP